MKHKNGWGVHRKKVMKKNYSYQKNEFKLIILYKFFLFFIIKKIFKIYFFLEILI